MGTILSAAELAEVRKEIEIVMPETGRVLRRTREQTAGGGYKERFTAVEPDIPAAIAPSRRTLIGGEPQSSGNRVDDRMPHTITVPATTDITAEDRIEIDGLGVYDVLAVAKRSEAITKQLEAKEVF